MLQKWLELMCKMLVRLGNICAWVWRKRCALFAVFASVICVSAAIIYMRYSRDIPETFYEDPVMHFKYGSTGGDRLVGIPEGIWNALPELCADYLPGQGLESLGFIYEEGMDRAVGTSKRYTLGFERISINCAVCHTGTYRETEDSEATVVTGMPNHRIDLNGLVNFLTECALDERFNPWQVVQAAERGGADYSILQKFLLRLAVPVIREALIGIRFRLRFLKNEPEPGPGRFDTFNPAKALLNWPFEKLPARETIGLADFPSLWLQGQREGMHLHWDGNNNSVSERNRSAAFGSGAMPTLLDRKSMSFIAEWLKNDAVPPAYPFPIDKPLAAQGEPLYRDYCASCHGQNGRDFSGEYVGQVDPIDRIRTDPCRLDNYTYKLAVDQGNLYAAFPNERFRHFRKTNGYSNMPLDGVWLRAPYLHNGSVPSVRDLLEPSENRPHFFYRGSDVIDQEKLGFVSDKAIYKGRALFRFETQCVDDPDSAVDCSRVKNAQNHYPNNICQPGPWAGNGNRGHEGEAYGTHLTDDEKDAIVEYLKTF